jgi:glutamate dehydrogenase
MAAVGCDAARLVTAFETARQVFRLDEAWSEVDALDLKVAAEVQLALYQDLARALRGQTYWLARHPAGLRTGVQALIDAYRPTVDLLLDQGADLLSPFEQAAAAARCGAYVASGVPDALARRVTGLSALAPATEIADLARETGRSVPAVAGAFNAAGSAFGFDRLRAAAAAIRPEDSYERIALRGLIIDLIEEQTGRTRTLLAEGASTAIEAWLSARKPALDRAQRTLDDIDQTAGGWTFAKLTIAASALRQVR